MESNREPRQGEHNQLLADIVSSAHNVIISKTLDGMITSWNKAAERMFGYSAQEAIGRPMSILIPPEKGSEQCEILESIRRGEPVVELETVRVRSDGTHIDVSVTISPLRDSTGKLVGACKVAREIPPRVLAERKFNEEREQLRVTLSSIADGIIATDEKGCVTYLNPAAEKLTGYSLTEAVGQAVESVFKIISEKTRRRAENPLPRVLQEGIVGTLQDYTALIAKDGTERAISDSAAPIRRTDGTIAGAVLVFRDVTEQRSAQALSARLAAIVESSEDAIISKDLTGRIQSWNAGAERIFGYKGEEVIGRHISLIIPPRLLKEETEILSRLKRGERVEHFDTVRLSKSGMFIDVSLTVSPIKDSDGRVIGASKIARDITERKRIHEAMRRAKENLEEAVEERTLRLRHAVTDLEHFSYSMSHDLRAPVRSIASYASILLSDYADRLAPEAVHCLRRICTSAERMDRLIRDALSYSKVAQADVVAGPVDLDRLVHEIVQQYPHFHSDHADVEVASPLLPVLGNEALLAQSLSNLLGNAVKFVVPGTKPAVRIWTEDRNGKVRLNVRDKGVGIPLKEQDRIWRIFERVHDPTRYDGTGIGLSLVKRAVERMGGTVGVESEPGKGSTFWAELPRVSADVGESRRAPA